MDAVEYAWKWIKREQKEILFSVREDQAYEVFNFEKYESFN